MNCARAGATARIFWVETLASLVQWDGAPASLSWLIDISARKQAQEQLIQSRETAERANRAKSNFLASMSHELRTPLNAIIGFSEIMRSELHGPLGKKYVEYVEDVHRSGRHLLELINDVLDMSKLEAEKHMLKETEVNVKALISGCVTLVRHGVREMGLKLVEKTPGRLPLVRADERALKQVLLNFLSNAIKFTPQGGCVTIGANFAPGAGMEVFVSDTGVGMSEDGIKVAMEPFGQLDSSIAHQSKGTGLGLPISFALMRLHGGDVTIASTPGEGTTLIARLPASRIIGAAA
jgi:signal transduction histidine kinase